MDRIDNLQLTDEDTNEQYEELMVLNRIGAGLWWLYRFVRDWESKLKREAASDDIQLAIAGGILVSCIRSSPHYSKVSEKIGNRILARTGETD